MIGHTFDLVGLIGCQWDLLSAVDEFIMFMGIRSGALLRCLRVRFECKLADDIKKDIFTTLKQ